MKSLITLSRFWLLACCLVVTLWPAHALRAAFPDEKIMPQARGLPAGGQPSGPRVVSLAPAITELVYALGAERALVGRTAHCNYPRGVERLPAVGSFFRPDMERIAALRPDICFGVVGGTPDATVHLLQQSGVNVILLDLQSVTELMNSLRIMGNVLQQEEQAQQVINSIQSCLSQLQKERDTRLAVLKRLGQKKPGVLCIVQMEPVIAAGPGTFFDELVTLAGGENAYTGLQSYPGLSAEELLLFRPDVILVSHAGNESETILPLEGIGKAMLTKKFGLSGTGRQLPMWVVPPDIYTRTTVRSVFGVNDLMDVLLPLGKGHQEADRQQAKVSAGRGEQ